MSAVEKFRNLSVWFKVLIGVKDLNLLVKRLIHGYGTNWTPRLYKDPRLPTFSGSDTSNVKADILLMLLSYHAENICEFLHMLFKQNLNDCNVLEQPLKGSR